MESTFESLREAAINAHKDVTEGVMMHAPAISYKGKVFAFYHKERMVFKLGKDFEPDSSGLKTVAPFNPFKNKGPLAGWFEIGDLESSLWQEYLDRSLLVMQRQLD